MIKRGSRRHRGFTLVELLVAIVVITIIGGMVTIALRGANASAKLTRGRSQIERLNLTVLQLYENESFRNVEAAVGTILPTKNVPAATANTNADLNRRARNSRSLASLNWKRDHLRCTFPDNVNDVRFPPVRIRYQVFTPPASAPTLNLVDVDREFDANLNNPTSTRGLNLARIRDRVFRLIVEARRLQGQPEPANFAQCVDDYPQTDSDNFANNNGEWTIENQSAECLYLILTTNVINDRPASDILRSREIRDTDGDGIPEVIDPWDQAVGWLRWPAGFPLYPDWQPTPPVLNPSELADRKSEFSRDPLDVLGVDPRLINTAVANYRADDTFALVPMVVSAGPDGIFGMFGVDTPSQYSYLGTTMSDMPDYNGGTQRFPHTLAFVGGDVFIDPYTHDATGSVPTNLRFGVRRDTLDEREDNSADNLFPALDFS